MATQQRAMADTAPRFSINPELDRAALRAAYEADGRVRVYNLLADGAVDLFEHLTARDDWIQLIATDDGRLELSPAARAALGDEAWAAIEARSHARVRDHFQYRYLALRVPGDGEPAADDLVAAFAGLMRSAAMLELLRAVTGHDEMSFTDGQATAYDVGDFLTGHDDDVAGKDRLAAYVFGLTPYWRIEYGGLLLFHDDLDRTAQAHAPRFNCLDLFRVPTQHSVTMVTPAAPHRRLSITGWLRGGTPLAPPV